MGRTANTIFGLAMVGVATAGCTSGNESGASAQTAATSTHRVEVPVPSTSSETMAAPTTPDYNTLAQQLNERTVKAQAGLQAVSAERLKQFVSIVDTKGYIDQQFDDKNVKRYVVKGSNGDVYTDELDYAHTIGTPGANPVKSISVFVRRPGEAKAGHVITDGDLYDDPQVTPPLDGIVDDPNGYGAQYANAQDFDTAFVHLQQQYGNLASDAERIAALEQGGTEAQRDYRDAVSATIGH